MNANDCGVPSLTYNNINTNGVILQNPNYGSLGYRYLPDTDCTYTLRKDASFSAPQYILVLRFLTSVQFSIPGSFPNCNTDYLEITVGSSNQKKFKFCGTEPPFPIYSHDGVIRVRTWAHSNSDGGKFRLQAFVKIASFGDACPFQRAYGSHGVVISPTYPVAYRNATCDHKIFVGSQKNINLYFFDIDLEASGGSSTCDAGQQQDYVEVRGTPYVSTVFEESQVIGHRTCGAINEIYTISAVRSDYVYIRFHSARGSNHSRGMYAAYSIYDKPKSSSGGSQSATPMLWIGIVCGIIILIIVVWMVIYKALNSKKQERAVVPGTHSGGIDTEYDDYVPNIPSRRNQQTGAGTAPPHSPIMPMEVPDYNPADLFAAKTVTLPPDMTDASLSHTLFANDKNNDLVSGLSPGYTTSQYEARTAGVV